MVLSGAATRRWPPGSRRAGRARDRDLRPRRRPDARPARARASAAWARPSASTSPPIAPLWDAGFLPVVSPVALGPLGEAVNVNADEAALGIARAVGATTLVYLSDVDGVRIGERTAETLSRRGGAAARSTTARSPAAWRSRCAWRSRPSAAGIPEVVIAGKARLLGQFPGTRIVAAAARGGETVTSALLPVYDRDLVAGEGQGLALSGTRTAASGSTSPRASPSTASATATRRSSRPIKKQAERLITRQQPVPQRARERCSPSGWSRLAFPSKVFFTNSGTEAIEGAMKFARRIGKEQGRTEIVAFEGSFHGRSMGALSITWTAKYREPFEPLIPGVRFVPRGDLAAVARGRRARRRRRVIDRAGAGRGRRPARDDRVPARPRRDLPRARRAPGLRRDPVRPGADRARCSPTSTRASCPTS